MTPEDFLRSITPGEKQPDHLGLDQFKVKIRSYKMVRFLATIHHYLSWCKKNDVVKKGKKAIKHELSNIWRDLLN